MRHLSVEQRCQVDLVVIFHRRREVRCRFVNYELVGRSVQYLIRGFGSLVLRNVRALVNNVNAMNTVLTQ